MDPLKEPRADAKLQSLPDDDLDTLWRFRHPEAGGEKLTLEAIAANEVPLRYGFTISLSSLSRFYRWLALKRRMDQRFENAEQLKAELARDTDMTEAQIKLAGQRMFMTEGILKRDVRMFADMVKIGQADSKGMREDKRIKLLEKAGKRDARRIALLEKKEAKLNAAKEVMGQDSLTMEEQNRRLREILK